MLSQSEKSELLGIARSSIEAGVVNEHLDIAVHNHLPALQEQGASFVTLKINGQLKGCIGSLQAYRPLVLDVSENAFAAAFNDTRFSPVTSGDLLRLSIQISVLSTPEVISFSSEQDLLKKLRPGIDGLILEDGSNRGTFLPSVWESLNEPKEFLMNLKTKAGLDQGYWSNEIMIKRYTTESFSEK